MAALGGVERRALLGGHALLDVDAGHLDEQRQVAEGRPEAGGLGGQVARRVDQALRGRCAPGPAAARRAPARPATARGDAVELVEQPGDGVALRVELDGRAGLVAQEQEAQQLGRQDVGDLVGRGAGALARCSSSCRRC